MIIDKVLSELMQKDFRYSHKYSIWQIIGGPWLMAHASWPTEGPGPGPGLGLSLGHEAWAISYLENYQVSITYFLEDIDLIFEILKNL